MPFADADLGYYFGAHGHVDNDSDPIGGAIDTGTPHDDAVEDDAIYRPTISTDEKEIRHIGYRKNEWTGDLVGMRFFLRSGGKPPTGSDVVSVRSSSAADTGKISLAYKHAGDWVAVPEEVQLAGVSPVSGLATWDADTEWLAIYEPGVPTGDLTISVGGETIGVIYGGSTGNYCASSLYQLALATSADADLEASNRLSDPSGIGSYSRATRWAGSDNSIAIPGDDLASNSYIGFCVKMLVPANLPKPFGALLDCDVCPIFDPVE